MQDFWVREGWRVNYKTLHHIWREKVSPSWPYRLRFLGSSSSLAAQGKLPVKKFGQPTDQKTNLAAMRTDSEAKRADQAQAQSTAAKARNQANKPV